MIKLFFPFLASLFLAVSSGQQRPNVVLILSDDLGYHDLGCYGHPKIKTPVIDRLAQEGVRLTSFYSGSTVCTPSRMALLTGSYPVRYGWSKGVVGHIMEKKRGLSPKATTMAEVFKDAGYKTGIFGKWHLGDEPDFMPNNQGFDESFFINKSNNQTKKIWTGGEVTQNPFDNKLLTEEFTNGAKAFIKKNKDVPFFLYVPYSAPHFPLEAHPDWKGKSDYGVYGDVVEEMDARVGEILIELKENNLSEKTIVVFMSDNGPEPLIKESKAIPFRGKKWSALEGGNRVPCIIKSSGKSKGGGVYNKTVSAMDILPSLAYACGIDISERSTDVPPIDGINLWDELTGKKAEAEGRPDLLFWHGADGFQAIRMGAWKLFLNRRDAELSGEGPALFKVKDDIKERNDLSKLFPAIVTKMKGVASQRLESIQKRSIPLGRVKQ
jgi:arylsulfatase A